MKNNANKPEPLHIHPRSLAEAGLASAAIEVYKHDARSKVWLIEHERFGPVVIKRFEYRPARQRLSLIVGTHPAQAELARNHQLRAAGVRAVEIIDAGEEHAGFGGRCWLATPKLGTSLQRLLTDPEIDDTKAEQLIGTTAALTKELVAAGYTFKDLKPSNIVIDDDGNAHLIDVGCAKRDTTHKQVTRMLAVMDRVLKRDGVSRALREYYREGVK